MILTFEDLAREHAESAQNAAVAILRKLLPAGSSSIRLTEAELVEALQFQLTGETSADGKSLAFKLEKKVCVL